MSSLLKAVSRMTITPTMLEAGVKSNSIPDRASLVCDVRALPGQDDAFVQQELEHILGGLGDVALTSTTRLCRTTRRPMRRSWMCLGKRLPRRSASDEFSLLPAITAGFTDSRFLRPLGTQTYGFSPHHPSAEPIRSGVHGNNEFMEVESLLLRTKYAIALACLTLGAD